MEPKPASIELSAFSCPHCGAYTTQTWHNGVAEPLSAPPSVDLSGYRRFLESSECEMNPPMRAESIAHCERVDAGEVFLDGAAGSGRFVAVRNLSLSTCFHCEGVAIWKHKSLLWPRSVPTVQPNPDLPDDIAQDFIEARDILDLSPRGAAALLRLCVQKICVHLGEDSKKIDSAIKSLVDKGLSPIVQQALDYVRVVGNEAVHPGVMDLRDDRDTVHRLFMLINTIAEQMITGPKHINELYQSLPEAKRKAIDARDKKPS